MQEGEIFGLLGPNGAGKTTTIKILMGLHFPTTGHATIMGKPLGDLSVKDQIGFLPENPHFYDYLTGYEFLNFYGQLYGIVYSCFWIGITSGPALTGRLYDGYGNYALALWIIVALFVAGTIAALSLPRFEVWRAVDDRSLL